MSIDTPVCKYHALGNCIRGSTCRYYHSIDPSGASPPTPTTAPGRSCPHYLRGTCHFGINCRLEHPSGPTRTPQLPHGMTAPASPRQSKLSPGILDPSALAAASERPPAEGTLIFPRKPIAFGPCKFFNQGQCTKGDHCPFPHVTPNPSASPETIADRTASKEESSPPQCRFFFRGRCRNGDQCPFSHLTLNSHPVPPVGDNNSVKFDEPPISTTTLDISTSPKLRLPAAETANIPSFEEGADSTTERTFLHCEVLFGPGATVQKITTAFESHFLILSNLPPTVTEADVIDLTETFGSLSRITVERPSMTVFPCARIEFSQPVEASRAVRELDGREWHKKKLGARLDLRAVESGTGTLLSRKVKISWYAPSVIAWAQYKTISSAKTQAAQLDGKIFDGRKLSVAFQAPKSTPIRRRPRHYSSPSIYSIEIKGLPLNSTEPRLAIFCNSDAVTIGQPSYNRQAGIKDIRNKLTEFGPLDSFEVLPADKSKAKITAFAQFSSSHAAAAAAQGLHNQSQTFLHGSRIWVEHIHSIKYNIPATQFSVVKTDLDCLRDVYDGRCTMRYYDRDELGQPSEKVCIRIYGTDAKQLGRAKVELEALIRGEVLMHNQNDIWDEYFLAPEGQTFLQLLNADPRFFVHCDARTRTLRAFGSKDGRKLAADTIIQKSQEITARRHIVHIKKDVLSALMKGGLKRLHDDMGPDTVGVDVVSRTLTIHGDDEDVERVHRAVAALALSSYSSATTMAAEALCPICFCEVTESAGLPCGHRYCRACLQHMLRSASGHDFSVLTCIAETRDGSSGKTICKAKIPYAIIRELLLPAEETCLLEASFLSHILSRPGEFRYCPTPDCQVVYRPGKKGTVLQCPSCLSRICASCHVEFHEGLSCAEYHDNLEGGNEAFQKWREEHGVKACPNCSAALEKNGGCNHIHCIICKIHICWKCMKTFEDDDSRGGIYQHMMLEHNSVSD